MIYYVRARDISNGISRVASSQWTYKIPTLLVLLTLVVNPYPL
jgi:hypothetical protein